MESTNLDKGIYQNLYNIFENILRNIESCLSSIQYWISNGNEFGNYFMIFQQQMITYYLQQQLPGILVSA